MIENFLLVLCIILLTAKILGSLAERLHLDSSLGELLTGVLLGPSVLGLIEAKSVEDFAILGSVLILFVTGLKQRDASDLYKDKKALIISLTLLILTTLSMAIIFKTLSAFFGVPFSWLQSTVLGIAFGIIDIGVPAKIMISKGLMSTPFGRIVVNSAMLNIIFGLIAFTILTIVIEANIIQILIKFAGIASFIAITCLLIHGFTKLSTLVIRMHIEEAEFSLAIILVLALAYMTEVLGFTSVLGAFIAGVLVSKTPFAGSRSFSDRLQALSFGLFIPLFFAWFGLEIHLSEIFSMAGFALSVFISYIVIRFAITYLFCKKYQFKAPLLISTSMLSVDVESLIVLLIAMNLGIFTDRIALTLFAPSVFLSTLVIVVLVALFSKIEKIRQ